MYYNYIYFRLFPTSRFGIKHSVSETRGWRLPASNGVRFILLPDEGSTASLPKHCVLSKNETA
jgi:hypothetical protein